MRFFADCSRHVSEHAQPFLHNAATAIVFIEGCVLRKITRQPRKISLRGEPGERFRAQPGLSNVWCRIVRVKDERNIQIPVCVVGRELLVDIRVGVVVVAVVVVVVLAVALPPHIDENWFPLHNSRHCSSFR